MKRFYQPVAIAALAVGISAMGLGVNAAADEWRSLRQGSESSVSQSGDRLTPASRMAQKGASNSIGNYLPSDGLQNIPVLGARPQRIPTRTIEQPRGTLYGIVARSATIISESDCYLARIDTKTMAAKPVFKGSHYFQAYGNDDYAYQGSAYHDGILYIPQLLAMGDIQVNWTMVNVETGAVVGTHYFGSETLADPYSMIWDPVKKVFYGVAITQDTHSQLVKIDPSDWSVTNLGNLGNGKFVAALVYNPTDQKVYAFDEDNNMWTVNTDDGFSNSRLSGQSPLGADFSLFPNNGAGLVVYSPMDRCYLAVYRDNAVGAHFLFSIDPDTLDAFEVGKISNADCYFPSIFCTDELADVEAPELPVAAVFDFKDASLSGKVTVTVPELTYYGLAIPASTPVRTVVTANGKQILDASLKAGQKHTFDVTLEEGLYNIETACYIDSHRSPLRRQKVYVGNDAPAAPSQLKLAGTVLSWRAPGAIGQDGGFVDTKALSYDVYVDGKKQNSQPVTSTSYTLTANISQALHNIGVTATANGHTSKPSSINWVFGKALNLPFSMKPTRSESELFTVANPSGDAFKWIHTVNSKDETQQGMAYPMSQYEDADDWLILPMLHFPSADMLYQYSFEVNSVSRIESLECFDIYLGRSNDYRDFTNKIYNIDGYEVKLNPKTFAVNFAVPEAGDYYLAIHCRSTKALEGKGMFTTNHTVKALDNKSSAVPGNPSDVTVTPAPRAALALDIELTMPTVDLLGNPLPVGKQLTATATCGNETGSVKGLPGAVVNFSCPVPALGFNVIDIVIGNDNGEGLHTTYRRYVGVDRPLPPTNIRSVTSEDNKSMTLTWDAPGEKGVNGGYVDPASLTYDIYMQTSALQYSTVAEGIKAHTYTFTTTSETMQKYTLGPVSHSAGGISSNSLFQRDALGTPFEVPMQEEFNTIKFNYSAGLYRFDIDGEYKGSIWENHNGCSQYEGLSGCVENQGAIMAFSESGGPAKARISLPKGSTLGINEGVKFKVRYWDYSLAPKTFTLYGRHSKDQAFKPLHEFKTERPMMTANAKWVDAEFLLPEEYHNNSWIELAIGCPLTGVSGEWFVIDSYEIGPDVEYDVKVNPITAVSHVKLGDRLSVTVPVFNVGVESNSGKLNIDLCQPDGSVVDHRAVSFRLPAHAVQERRVVFEVDGSFAKFDKLTIKATAVSDMEDQVPSNNTRSLNVAVEPNQLPAVSSLKGKAEEVDGKEAASLSWRAPQVSYGNVEDFELMTPFEATDELGDWKNIDLDGRAPAVIGSGNLALTFPGYEKPSAWTVINPSETVFKDDARITAHTGQNCLLARALFIPDQTVQFQANDWLISPELSVPVDDMGNEQSVKLSFWYNTISSSDKEYVYLWISYTGTDLDQANATETRNGDFFRVRPFSKVGPEGWEYVEYDLPAGTKHFALVYSSFAAVGALIDDIHFTPERMKTWEIDHYAVYRSSEFGEELLQDNLTDLSFIDKDYGMPSTGAKYWVVAYVKGADGKLIAGPKSNIVDLMKENSGVGALESLEGVFGGRGQIFFSGLEGKALKIMTLDGKHIASIAPASSNYAVSMDAGIYIVADGNKSAKIIVR